MSEEQDRISIVRIGLRHVRLFDYVAQDDLLSRAPLLALLSDEERGLVLSHAEVRLANAREVLLEEGKSTPSFHFVLDGIVQLSVGGGTVDLGTLGKGDFFGLSSVMSKVVFPAAVATVAGTRVALLQRKPVLDLAKKIPAFAQLLMETALRRNRQASEGADFLGRW